MNFLNGFHFSKTRYKRFCEHLWKDLKIKNQQRIIDALLRENDQLRAEMDAMAAPAPQQQQNMHAREW